MKKIQELKLIELLAVYVGLFIIYVVTPESLTIIRRIISPLMLVAIAVIFLNSLQFFKKR